MFGLGVGEIIVILVIALIFIGPKKLPEIARTIGKGLGEFQNAMRGINHSIQNPTQDHHQNSHVQGPPQQEFYAEDGHEHEYDHDHEHYHDHDHFHDHDLADENESSESDVAEQIAQSEDKSKN